MKSNLTTLPAFDGAGKLSVIIETPRGGQNKYSYDAELGIYRLKKILGAGLAFPFDFGMVPGTLGGDGDPLDVLLLIGEPVFPGCLVPARLVGVIKAAQGEKKVQERNDRLIAVADEEVRYGRIKNISDLANGLLDEIENFFITYNRVRGKKFRVKERGGAKAAFQIVREGQKRFLDKFRKQETPL